jgi:uncharacterized protein (TIGR00290 family)
MAARAWMSWSSGKDSALALHRARQDRELDVVGLLCTVNTDANRVAMHAVRRELLLAQGERVGLPVRVVELPWPCPNAVYEERMAEALAAATREGVERMVFGDLFLADIRAYREQMLAGTGIAPVFPLWDEPTGPLAREMLAVGIRAVLTCVDPAQLPGAFAGRAFDAELLDDLPASVDPCGENGEFHTFVWDGPGFAAPIPVAVGDVVTRDNFVFADVVPAAAG